jgi:hypothetical protein
VLQLVELIDSGDIPSIWEVSLSPLPTLLDSILSNERMVFEIRSSSIGHWGVVMLMVMKEIKVPKRSMMMRRRSYEMK